VQPLDSEKALTQAYKPAAEDKSKLGNDDKVKAESNSRNRGSSSSSSSFELKQQANGLKRKPSGPPAESSEPKRAKGDPVASELIVKLVADANPAGMS